MSQVYKHVFLDFQEYQRLLDTKKRCEVLAEKVKKLEKEIVELKEAPKEGTGNLSGVLARKEERDNLKQPLPGIIDSITLPPSAQFEDSQKSEKKWYYLGKPE